MNHNSAAMIKKILQFPKTVSIMEVGPRDGLQNEKVILGTNDKISFINSLSQAGYKRIEITAFVSPKWIPPLADHNDVARGITKYPNISYAALVPNLFGYEKARDAGIDEVSIVLSASQTHNKKNINATTQEAFERYKEVVKTAIKDKIPIRAYLSCSFACPYEGAMDPQVVALLCLKLYELGVYEVSLSDTIGVASPFNILRLLEETLKYVPIKSLGLHLHDTFGMALANILAGLQVGITSFDSSAGGMGGCPYAKGALGNVASEDLLYMLHSMGIETGVSLPKVCDASLQIEKKLQKMLSAKVLNNYRVGLKSEK